MTMPLTVSCNNVFWKCYCMTASIICVSVILVVGKISIKYAGGSTVGVFVIKYKVIVYFQCHINQVVSGNSEAAATIMEATTYILS